MKKLCPSLLFNVFNISMAIFSFKVDEGIKIVGYKGMISATRPLQSLIFTSFLIENGRFQPLRTQDQNKLISEVRGKASSFLRNTESTRLKINLFIFQSAVIKLIKNEV